MKLLFYTKGLILPLNTNEEKISLLQDLTTRWQRRHEFLWSAFFKMYVFYFIAITSPAIFYFTIAKDNKTLILRGFTLFFSLLVFVFVCWSLPRVIVWLSSEEKRQKAELEVAREIYKELDPKYDIAIKDKKDCEITIYTSTKTLMELTSYNEKQGIIYLLMYIFRMSIFSYAAFVLLGFFIVFYGKSIFNAIC